MADSEDILLKQLTKNLYDYEDDDLTDDQSKGVVKVAYGIIKENKASWSQQDQKKFFNQLKTYGAVDKLSQALMYLLDRNQQKYGGGGLIKQFFKSAKKAITEWKNKPKSK